MPADTVQLVTKTDSTVTVSVPTATYTANFEKLWTEQVADAELFNGVAFYEIFRVDILKNGKVFLSTVEHIYRLNEQNTVPQNRYLQTTLEDGVIVEHDAKKANFVVPVKTQFILDALNKA